MQIEDVNNSARGLKGNKNNWHTLNIYLAVDILMTHSSFPPFPFPLKCKYFLVCTIWYLLSFQAVFKKIHLPLPSTPFQNTIFCSACLLTVAIFLISLTEEAEGMGLCFGGYPACCNGKNTCGPFCASCRR